MSILPIVTYDDPVLREKAAPITENTPELQQLIDDMFETMYNGQGVGLAAPQIGRSIRLFVTDSDPFTKEEETEDVGPITFINPELISDDGEKISMDEGCLSIPGVREAVKRPDSITVRFLDREFKPQERRFSGWMSRVFQHELDHINGVLFIDYLGSFRKRMLRSVLKRVKEGTEEAGYPVAPKVSPVNG
ncbi:MAG: peptide deformylase [Cyclonatronaceae bacterium]